MILVIDANVLFSALVKDGTTRAILLLSQHDFFTPEFAVQEIKEHLKELEQKTGLSEKELLELFEKLLSSSSITIIPLEDFANQENTAKKISPDLDDIAYVALALHLNCTIWSNDSRLKKQDKIRIITTEELLLFQKTEKQ